MRNAGHSCTVPERMCYAASEVISDLAMSRKAVLSKFRFEGFLVVTVQKWCSCQGIMGLAA